MKTVWIGLAKIVPHAENNQLGDAKGAFVNVLACVEDQASYCSAVRNALKDYEFDVLSIEDIDVFSERLKTHKVSENLVTLSEEVNTSGNVRFGTFYSFDDNTIGRDLSN